ncbi:MAG: VIT and VWA domain-containing protein [Melioribacteraceae bacterium]|nr:VIT and VWA domain-containing protein [Melioribacteraceae bacterium]
MKKLLIIILVLAGFNSLFADGLMMPTNENYPKDFLRNKITDINVTIDGFLAKTIVYQEFLNESNLKTDAVYSFPLPPDARAVNVLYWYRDTLYQAVLKVQEQAPNPGTGEGGVAALVNSYIGRNGLKVYFKNILPNTLQKVELHYVSLLDFHKGEALYNYPLFTKEFVDYPIDYLSFKVTINSKQPITDYAITSHSGFTSSAESVNKVNLSLSKSKAYLDQDIELKYKIDNNITDTDFYSIANDSLDGHFALFIKQPNEVDSNLTFENNFVYLINTTSRVAGVTMQQSVEAVKDAINLLKENDKFSIIAYNSIINKFSTSLIEANESNIESAFSFLDGLTPAFGNNLEYALNQSFEFFSDPTKNNAIIAFADGRSVIDPYEIQENNTHSVGIFSIAIGDDVDRAKLEMISMLNNGFVKYFKHDKYDKREVAEMFEKLSKPVLKNINLEFDDEVGVYSLMPFVTPTGFAGSYSFVAGRYQNSGFSEIVLNGININGTQTNNYQVEFTEDKYAKNFSDKIWAKEMIDMLERKVAVFGENQVWKDSLIDLSLTYNIRCKYTAYIADYETLPTSVEIIEDEILLPDSYIQGNYPNPFNPSTKIKFYLSAESFGKIKFIKIFNILGQLINVIDISGMGEGWHEITVYGKNYYGEDLSAGVYIASLEIGGEIRSSIKLLLVK